MRLNVWRDVVHELAKEKGWWDQKHQRSFGELIALVHSELSEALEEYRDGHSPVEIRFPQAYLECETHNKGKPEGVPIELADVLIRVLDLCGWYGIDIETAVAEKHRYNRTRPTRHGGKKI